MATHRNRNRAASKIAAATSVAHDHDFDYSALLTKVRESFDAHTGPLFRTDAEGLYELYLAALPSERQVHTCHACARFIRTYGGLATVNDDGSSRSAMWAAEGIPEFYLRAFDMMAAKVQRARIVTPFLSKERIWGTPMTDDWSHPAVVPSETIVYREGALTAGQAMAARRENFTTVARALADFKPAALDELIRIFDAEALSRSERFAEPIKWLRGLYDRPKGRKGENLLWRAVAVAPEGFCHPRSSVAAPLLDAIGIGESFAVIKARFDEMTHGLRYQRPQAAPTVGNIKAAEVLVEKLGIARSLERRFARLDEMPTMWAPTPALDRPHDGGVFGHLNAYGRLNPPSVQLPTQTLTWEKFARTILPNAEKMEVIAPSIGNYRALLTAQHAAAPLIFKWPNPFSGYVYHRGSSAEQWGLPQGRYVPVAAIVVDPSQHDGDEAKYLEGDRLLLVLEGARDTRTGQGNALFPENLHRELYAVRVTIEAYSRNAAIGEAEGQLASGLDLSKASANHALRVLSRGAWTAYQIDRWD